MGFLCAQLYSGTAHILSLLVHRPMLNPLSYTSQGLTHIISCNPYNNSVREVLLLPHFPDEKTEAQKG